MTRFLGFAGRGGWHRPAESVFCFAARCAGEMAGRTMIRPYTHRACLLPSPGAPLESLSLFLCVSVPLWLMVSGSPFSVLKAVRLSDFLGHPQNPKKIFENPLDKTYRRN
jgi:hypothetical protein